MRWRCALLVALLCVGPTLSWAAPRELVETRARIGRLRSLIERHRDARGALPQNVHHLGDLARIDAQPVPVRAGVPVDAWERGVQYRVGATGGGYALYSLGENGLDEDGGGDDVTAAVSTQLRGSVRRAQQLWPLVVFAAVGPIAFAAIRHSRRAAGL